MLKTFQPQYCFVYAIKFSLDGFWFLSKNMIRRQRKGGFSNETLENSGFELKDIKLIHSTNIAKYFKLTTYRVLQF